MDELLRHDGPGDATASTLCCSCNEVEGSIKCKDCFCQLLRCRQCVVDAHKDLPLHRVEVSSKMICLVLFAVLTRLLQQWTGKFFEKITLKSLGLRYQLGHGGSRCPLPSRGPSDFLIFDTTGVHHIAVDFCDCRPGIFHRRIQLLRTRWFPATVNRPKTVFTFNVLQTFHELSLQGKTTAFDFYYSILRITDNLQLGKYTVCI